jgi:hypothetical protein
MANLPSGSDGPRFTDREMKLIFERAGEADVAAHSEQGYSLAEMQEIARQLGLNPTEVAKRGDSAWRCVRRYPHVVAASRASLVEKD